MKRKIKMRCAPTKRVTSPSATWDVIEARKLDQWWLWFSSRKIRDLWMKGRRAERQCFSKVPEIVPWWRQKLSQREWNSFLNIVNSGKLCENEVLKLFRTFSGCVSAAQSARSRFSHNCWARLALSEFCGSLSRDNSAKYWKMWVK